MWLITFYTVVFVTEQWWILMTDEEREACRLFFILFDVSLCLCRWFYVLLLTSFLKKWHVPDSLFKENKQTKKTFFVCCFCLHYLKYARSWRNAVLCFEELTFVWTGVPDKVASVCALSYANLHPLYLWSHNEFL